MQNTATTWRDLADELTPQQVEDFAYRETVIEPGPDRTALFLQQARRHVEGNRIDRERFGHVPAPAGARRVWHWEVDRQEGGWHREFEGREWKVAAVSLFVQGRQFPDATVHAEVTLDATAAILGAEELRALAAVLCEAAQELEGGAG